MSAKRESGGTSGRLGSILRAVGQYAMNPVTVASAYVRGYHVHSTAGTTLYFEVESPWEAASVIHTFKKEGDVLSELTADLDADDVLYDVGANLGVYACHAGASLSEGTVVAFEPDPENADRLETNIEQNGVDGRVLECALWDDDGTADLSVGRGRATNQRHAITREATGRSIEVETVAGDSLVDAGDIPPPTVVKIDVEGAERRVIDGLASTLASEDCRLVYCEIHTDDLPDDGASVRTDLEGLGFSVECLYRSGSETYLRAEK